MNNKKQSHLLSISPLSFFILILGFQTLSAQDKGRTIPAVDVKTLDGRTFNTSEIENNGKPIIISFWATWCKPCVTELNNIDLIYEEWQEETGVKLIAISIDDARNLAKVAPFVNGKGWDYDIYLDPNGDLKRAMNVNMVPHTFLVNSDLQVVYQHNSYAEGDELKLYDRIKKLSQGISIAE
jgi:cytochrome c biogenesis protein CcmG/thiol:disulfide interchange protein DsbE